MEQHKRLLFVGNSLTYWNRGVDVFVANLGGFRAERIVEPGASLQRLWQNGRAAAKIRDGGWDWIVLQEDLPETSRAQFEQAARSFAEAAAAVGAQVVLFMAWSYERLPTTHAEVVSAHIAMAASLGWTHLVASTWRSSPHSRPWKHRRWTMATKLRRSQNRGGARACRRTMMTTSASRT